MSECGWLCRRVRLKMLTSLFIEPSAWGGPRCPDCDRPAVIVGGEVVCGEVAMRRYTKKELLELVGEL